MSFRSQLHARLLVPTSIAAACVLLLAGCTPRQSESQYQERVDQAAKVQLEVSAQLDARQLDDAVAYDAAAKRVAGSLEELDADPPPRNLEGAHERMVAGMEGLRALLDRMGRCEALAAASEQDRRACRQSIGQDVFDTIRNDFAEANTIYRQEGMSLPGQGGDSEAKDSLGEDPEGGDEL